MVVSLRREDCPHGAWAVLRVHDQGPGIAPPVLRSLMTRFVRGQHSKGLGLAHSIVQAHGGTLTVESTLAQGTTFQLAVPLATG